jgi:hypothetical protein
MWGGLIVPGEAAPVSGPLLTEVQTGNNVSNYVGHDNPNDDFNEQAEWWDRPEEV